MAGLGCFLALVLQSTCPSSSAFTPNRLKDSIPPNSSLPGRWDKAIKAAVGDTVFLLPWLQMPRAVCSSPVVPLQPGMRGPAPARVTSDPLTSLITPPSCLSGLALLAQVAGAPPPGSLGRALAPGVAGGSAQLRELAGDAELGAAAAARDRGGWECPRLATPMCHSLQGSQPDELTQIL